MRVTFSFTAELTDAKTGAHIRPPDISHFIVCDDRLEYYLPTEAVDAGAVGGEVWISVSNGDARLSVTYWIPNDPSDEILGLLKEDTVAQLEDGIGEGGFEFKLCERPLVAKPQTECFLTCELVDDGRSGRAPVQVAVAARDRDVARLSIALESASSRIDELHQGYSALHYAILNGDLEIVRILLREGADPNLKDHTGTTPLELCALTNAVADNESCAIAGRLLQAGADRDHVTESGESAKSFAEARGKTLLAALL